MGFELRAVVVGSGFEPLKAKPADLQSAPIGHSGNPPDFASYAGIKLNLSTLPTFPTNHLHLLRTKIEHGR